MITTSQNSGNLTRLVTCASSCATSGHRRRVSQLGLLLLAAAALTASTQAQSIRFTQPQLRVTIPVNFSGSSVVTNEAVVDSPTGPINVSLSGLPDGAGYNLSANGFTASTPLQVTLNTTNVAEGVYTLSLNADGGATNHLLFTLEVGHIWNGSTNAAADGAGNWSDSSQWLGGVPGNNSHIIFNDLGGQTNTTVVTASATNALVNSVIGSDTTIASLRFASTNASSGFHTLRLDPGVTLSVTGSNGFSLLRDYVDEMADIGRDQGMTVTMLGPDNASLVVSNENADFALLIDNITVSTLDLSGLDNFLADVNVLGINDPYVYPNYWNFQANNGYNARPRRMVCFMNMARTNVVKASFVDPFNYTNAVDREYALLLTTTPYGSASVGGSPIPILNLGVSNAFFLDGVLFAGANQRSTVQFNPLFITNNPVAYFRNTDGGRMSVFTESDGAGTNGAQGNIKAVVNFSGGTLDMLVDRFYIGRDRPKINYNQTPNYQGYFVMGNGIVDANTAVLGYREYAGAATNDWGEYRGYCEGRFTISSNGIFKVNGTLTLGYSAETNANGLGSGGNTTWGQLYVFNGGTVMASNIMVGEPEYTSLNNFIVVSNNSTLMISNGIAGPAQALDSLRFYDNSTLVMQLDGDRSTPYVYATNIVTSGAASTIRISSLRNMAFPAFVPVISYVSGSPSFNVSMPPLYTGALIPSNNILYLNITTNLPKHLVWNGSTPTWDTTSANWLDQDTGLVTNFANGDFVTFSDNPAFPTSISVNDTVIPSGIAMTNSTFNYTFGIGGGSIQGSALLTKAGAGTLQIDTPATIGVHLTRGALTGSGSVGAVTLDPGTTMDFSGSINGSVVCGGSGQSAGSIKGTISILSGGVFTNLPSGSINGGLQFADHSLLYNGGSIMNIGSPTVVSNATLINAGTISGTSLGVSGTLVDEGSPGSFVFDQALTINDGGTFIPGGEGIGTTYVYGSGTAAAYGRVILGTGSTNVFKVDVNNFQPNTMLLSVHMSFGPNQTAKSFNGGTIKVENIGSTPFSAGQSFKMFGYVFDPNGDVLDAGLNTTNNYSIMDPPAPGPGLAWDLSNLIPGGYVNVISVATNPVDLSFVPSLGTTYSTNVSGSVTNITTNSVIFVDLDWPENHLGWRLQQQQNPLTVGLSTNWADLWTSFSNSLQLTNVLTTNTASFYRMVYP